MLLPDRSPLIRIEDDGPNVRAAFRERWWSFPREECVLLPVANTTAELLATYFGDRLLAAIRARGLAAPGVLRVEVEECFGQWARVEFRDR